LVAASSAPTTRHDVRMEKVDGEKMDGGASVADWGGS
jgi:hypothetical protein